MKIAVYSDLHVEFGVFYPPADLQADVVVLAGDILCPGERVPRWVRRGSVFGDRPAFHVADNHEYYGTEYHSQLRLMREQAKRWGVHFLQQDTVVIDGVRFVGTTLWTDFELFAADALGADPVPTEAQSAREIAMFAVGKFAHRPQGHPLAGREKAKAVHAGGRATLAFGGAGVATAGSRDALRRPYCGRHAPCAAPRFARSGVRDRRPESGVREPVAEGVL